MTDQEGYLYAESELSLSNSALVGLMQEVLLKDKDFRFRASGWSMSPFIQDGDLINISPLGNSPVEVGEVVAFVSPNTDKLIVHRIVQMEQNGYLTQGDNQVKNNEDLILTENILGRVTQVERAGEVIRFGLGPEKRLIALFSRRQLLQPFLLRLAALMRPFRRALS